jgi:hypothetical protein
MTQQAIEALLGKPDSITKKGESVWLVYESDSGNPERRLGIQLKADQLVQWVDEKGNKSAFFDETNPAMFVLIDRPVEVQRHGYSSFCRKPTLVACVGLSYPKYNGKRGYFLSHEPVAVDSYGFDFREVLLETGERFYLAARHHPGAQDVIGQLNGQIDWLKEIELLKSQIGQPIVEGSAVVITDAKRLLGTATYYLGEGEGFSEDELDLIRRLLATLSSRDHDRELVDVLKVCTVKWDRIERRYLIDIAQFYVEQDPGPIHLSVTKTQGSVQLTGTVTYRADDWLFVNRYILVAGEKRYESPQLDFRRDHEAGNVWEWTSFNVDETQRSLVEAVVSSPDPVLRFHGRDYYSDKEVNTLQRDALRKLLRVFDILRGSP